MKTLKEFYLIKFLVDLYLILIVQRNLIIVYLMYYYECYQSAAPQDFNLLK